MAQKLGFLDQVLFGDHADRSAINRNAAELDKVGASVEDLRAVVQSQAKEILQLRALLTGLVEVIQPKLAFHDAELESAVRTAWNKLSPPPPPPPTDPYRGVPSESTASPEEEAAASKLLGAAQKLHFDKRFGEARTIYQNVVDTYEHTGAAVVARQQLKNLKGA